MSRVLVVDDSTVMRRVIRTGLSMCGLEDADVVEARDGQEALETIRRQAPALIISDEASSPLYQ